LAITWTEAVGFATGAVCVWLIVKENILNWPVGLVNNVFYFVIFFTSRLYADMLLQAVFFTLGLYGWWHWLFGGKRRDELAVSCVSAREWLILAILIPVLTAAGQRALAAVNDAAPFMDALTTSLSLAAQYLMTLKRIEHWWLWIAANLLYIPLYVNRDLPLTAVLYAGYLALCTAGLVQWKQRMTESKP
jgi:nicotinamide mononucleotide transporter